MDSNKELKQYKCICGFTTTELREFRAHLLRAGREEVGKHISANPTQRSKTAAVIKQRRGKQARKVTRKGTSKKTEIATKEMEVVLPSGETLTGVSEVEKNEREKELANRIEVTPEEEDTVKSKAGEGVATHEETGFFPEKIVGEGIPYKIAISAKTLYLYQLAATSNGDNLTMGEFIDRCVEDFFTGRGYDLGLLRLGGSNG